jgi:hypothetical protein
MRAPVVAEVVTAVEVVDDVYSTSAAVRAVSEGLTRCIV